MSLQTPHPGQRSRPKAVLLDLGGVIIDIDPRACFAYWARAADIDAAKIAARWAVDEAYEAFEVGTINFDEYIGSLSRRLGITLTRDHWRRGWNELLREPFAEVARVLENIAQTVPLYAFSNTNPVHQAVWESRLAGVLASFDDVYTSWEIGLRKPDVEAFRRVTDHMGVPPNEVLFIDDNRENVSGARAARLDARHVVGPDDTVAILKRLVTRS